MSTLPPTVTKKFLACGRQAAAIRERRRQLEETIDDVISQDGMEAIPEEALDDPSVVREVAELRLEIERSRRAAGVPLPQPLLAAGSGRR